MAVKYSDDERVEVQLTSMMDCIFLMLIFFLVSSQLKKIERELPVTLPEADAARNAKVTADLITVAVDAKGEIYVNAKPVAPGGLRNALREAAKECPERRIRICGDMFAPFLSVVRVLDACQSENLDVVGILTARGTGRRR